MGSFSERSDVAEGGNVWAEARARRRATGLPLVDWVTTDPTRAGLFPEEDVVAFAAALSQGARAPYTPAAFGLRRAREALSEVLEVAPDRLVLLGSTSEGYSLLAKLLADVPGCVALPAPCYPLLPLLFAQEGLACKRYPLVDSGPGFVPVWPESFAQKRGADPSFLVTVSPASPTGECLDAASLAWLAQSRRPVVIDAVFEPYAAPLLPRPLGAQLDALPLASLVVVLGGLSKFAGLPQAKLAWMSLHGPASLVAEAQRRLAYLADSLLSPSGPIQHALPALLKLAPQRQMRLKQRLAENTLALEQACVAAPWLRVKHASPAGTGGWYRVIEAPAVFSHPAVPAGRSDVALALHLLDAGLELYPGELFGFDSERLLVLSALAYPAALRAHLPTLIALTDPHEPPPARSSPDDRSRTRAQQAACAR